MFKPDEADVTVKDFWQIAAWIVAVIGGLVAAYKAITEMRLSRIQREREFAWHQAKAGAAILELLDSKPLIKAAAMMLDWTDREYALPSGIVVRIDRAQLLKALRAHDTEFTRTEAYIRDCFDAFYGYLDQVERAITAKLVREADVCETVGYYVKNMARDYHVFQTFMTTYGYTAAIRFAHRVPEWKNCFDKGDSREKEESDSGRANQAN